MKRRAKKTDGNQSTIVDGLRAHGVSVRVTSMVGDGFADAVCGYHGLTALLEIKMPLPTMTSLKGGRRGGKRLLMAEELAARDPLEDLTPAEKKFHAEWQGQPIAIVRSLQEALAVFGLD